MRFLSPFLLSSATTDNPSIYTQATEAALVISDLNTMENISISNLHLLQNLAGTPLGYPVNRAVTAPWKHLRAHICVFHWACPAGLFFTRHNPILLVKYEALSDYDDLAMQYLSERDCPVLFMQQHSCACPAHGMGSWDCKLWQESSLLYEPASYPVRAQHSVTKIDMLPTGGS